MAREQSIKNAKLTAREVPDLRRRLAAGLTTVKAEADRYMVSPETIRRANRGETFRHVREGLEEVIIAPLAHPPLADAEAALQELIARQRPIEEDSALDIYLDPRKRAEAGQKAREALGLPAATSRPVPLSPLDGGDGGREEGDVAALAKLERDVAAPKALSDGLLDGLSEPAKT